MNKTPSQLSKCSVSWRTDKRITVIQKNWWQQKGRVYAYNSLALQPEHLGRLGVPVNGNFLSRNFWKHFCFPPSQLNTSKWCYPKCQGCKLVQHVKTRPPPHWKRTLESALGGSSAEPHPGKDLNNVMSVLNLPPPPCPSLPEPENGTRRRRRGEKEDTTTHIIPMDQNSPHQDSLT